jgi:hypothetical protein
VDTDSFRNIRTRLISMICGVCKIIWGGQERHATLTVCRPEYTSCAHLQSYETVLTDLRELTSLCILSKVTRSGIVIFRPVTMEQTWTICASVCKSLQCSVPARIHEGTWKPHGYKPAPMRLRWRRGKFNARCVMWSVKSLEIMHIWGWI